ncbi:MAG TPA: orotate phosphoribosyltransferase [Spirochaetota bacterium]|nr:orotate phosphoribosyltransferase [Spirochaetota bacterium]HOD14809.1 orotate phosphoribosyltransferase [Spirochaetota bacterium]HPG50210.1 orotate phosphoribosyltransferase [Spirochaetota bacterium]HPN11326.1 orotate phosphoribosyltransferase [Spirochaetota bacterium]HQL82157.1 orotate phosphoribosyltransferase [Spirochaetota bacterium]
MPTAKEQLFDILYAKSFIYREDPPFTLVSGRQSFYYFDCKATTLDARGVSLIGEVMFDAIEPLMDRLGVDGIGGLTLGADPISISTAIAAQRRGRVLSPLIVRKEPKKHGTQKWIEGDAGRVKNVVVIDDVITTGGSTVTAIERLRESGLKVVRAAVIIDREEGGREGIEKAGIEVVSLYTRSDFDARRLEGK